MTREKIAEEAVKSVEGMEKGKAKEKYSEAELVKIFDEIIFQGEYVEQVNIKGKLTVEFRTRTADETEKITAILDKTPPNFNSTLDQRRTLLNLIYALNRYNDTDLTMVKFEEKEAFVKKLPTPVVGAMMIALSKFDEKIYEACSTGEVNF